MARINQKLGGRVGFINPQLYAMAPGSAFRDVTSGDNRVTYESHTNVGYDATIGWDAASGLGSPIGTNLATLLTVAPLAAHAKSAKRGKGKKHRKHAKRRREELTAAR